MILVPVLSVLPQYNDSYSELIYSYANNINTEEGGTHLVGFKNALTKVINDYASRARCAVMVFITSSFASLGFSSKYVPNA